MSILDDELARLITLARQRNGTSRDADGAIEDPITDRTVEAAWIIASAVPFVEGVKTDADGHWSRIAYPGDIELDICIDAYGDIDFDFDRGDHRNRCMLSLIATRTGGVAYSIYTPSHKQHGGIGYDVTDRLAELFQHFTEG